MTLADTTDSPERMRLCNIAAAVLLAFFLEMSVETLWAAQRQPLLFDDAYMFARYATNLRHGLGVSWNLNGGHTFGETSLLWGAVVWLFSFLPLHAWTMLTLASWLCGLGATAAMAWAVAKNAVSPLFQSTWRVWPMVALPLAGAAVFVANEAIGMETMLATLLGGVFVGVLLGWQRGAAGSVVAGGVGLLLFAARPEAGLAVVLMPLLMLGVMRSGSTMGGRGVTVQRVRMLLGVFGAGVVVMLAGCREYFGSALPLAFYMKGRGGYDGYAEVWHPGLLMMAFFAGCQLYLAAMLLLARREDWRLLLVCMGPALAVFAYLFGVTQIMGFHARYYVPYFAFFVVPALLLADRRVAAAATGRPEGVMGGQRGFPVGLTKRMVMVAAMMLVFLALSSERVQAAVRHAAGGRHVEYAPVELATTAPKPLPRHDWASAMTSITDDFVAPLPAGVTVAATEVGYLGSRAVQVNVIDMAGLNDTEIARRGFDAAALLARKPDVIWLPNDSYTSMRGELLSAPAMLADYAVYAGAANYSIAIREDSPYRGAVEQEFQQYWQKTYPGLSMQDYRVTSVRWSGQKHVVVGS